MVDAVTTTNAASRINSSGTMLASNFETFLSLLTTQLKNQDPLSPVDSNEFTAQLTQMAGVEQQLLTNDLLTSLLSAQQGNGLADAANYIGKEATAVWNVSKFEDGSANWSYELAGDAASATLQVVNSAGTVVWSGDAPDKTEGVHQFDWNGQTTGGGQVADGGVYTLKITAKNTAGAAVDAQVLIEGRITGVEIYDGEAYATIGKSIMPISTLIAMDEAKTAATEPEESESLVSQALSALNPMNLIS